MALQWLSAAAFLYVEIALGLLLCLPFISNARWQRIFHSRLLVLVFQYGNFYFSAFVLIMMLLFADSVFQTYRYSKYDQAAPDLRNNPQAEIQAHMKLFRAQRNMYISGFSLFMLWILRRLVTLISRQATLEASHEATLKQALGATEQCKILLDENEKLKVHKVRNQATNKVLIEKSKTLRTYISALKKGKKTDEDSESEEEKNKFEKKLEAKDKELQEKETELERAQKDLQAMKAQSEGLHKEYDRLVEEYNVLQKKLATEGDESKKDD